MLKIPMAKNQVSMPMGSAGIIGMSSDTKLSGVEFDPKVFVVVIFVLVIIVNIAARFTA